MTSNEGNHYGSGSSLLAFLCGALMGASAALLFAPMRGTDMRASIGDRARYSRDRLREYSHTGREWAAGRVSDANEISRSALHRATEAVDTAVDRAQEAVSQGASRAHGATERARTALGRGLETARTATKDVTDAARDTAKDLGDQASETAKRSREQWS